jgi:hypothetical protein
MAAIVQFTTFCFLVSYLKHEQRSKYINYHYIICLDVCETWSLIRMEERTLSTYVNMELRRMFDPKGQKVIDG